jgi:hypothetical protein
LNVLGWRAERSSRVESIQQPFSPKGDKAAGRPCYGCGGGIAPHDLNPRSGFLRRTCRRVSAQFASLGRCHSRPIFSRAASRAGLCAPWRSFFSTGCSAGRRKISRPPNMATIPRDSASVKRFFARCLFMSPGKHGKYFPEKLSTSQYPTVYRYILSH